MKINKLTIIIILFMAFMLLSFLFSNIYAKDLIYQGKISKDDEGAKFLTFRKYVRHYGSNSDTEWKYSNDPLSSQSTSTRGSYVTQAMIFHKNYGTNYLGSWSDDSKVLEIGYDLSSGNTKIPTDDNIGTTEQEFFNKYNIVSAREWIKLYQPSGNDIGMGTYFESGDILINRSKILDNMAITDFKVAGDTYTFLIDAIKANITPVDKEYRTMVSGNVQVITWENSKSWNVKTTQEIIDVMIPGDVNAYYNGNINSVWTADDFGYWSKASNSALRTGYSVVNNFDNWLYINYDEVNENRDVYVTYKVKGDDTTNGIFWDLLDDPNGRYQTLKDGTKVQSSGSVTLRNDSKGIDEYWLEHYTLSEDQRNLLVNYEESLVNSPYSGIQYQYDSVEVKCGSWNQTYTNTSVEVANDDSNKPIYVTFYYTPKVNNKSQYVYIKHVNADTGAVISELKASETFSEGFKENDLKTWAATDGYQTAYSLKADGITNGGIYNRDKVNANSNMTIGGNEYVYQGYRTYTSTSESTAKNRVQTSSLKKSSGVWINTSTTTKYTTVVFYYKPKQIIITNGNIPDVELVGKLDFINTEKYKSTTDKTFNTSTADVIPASVNGSNDEWLSPYVNGAYPYIVRAMKYSTKSKNYTVNPKITLKKRWSYTTTDAEGNTTVHSGVSSQSYTYNVKITHKYYNIDNFKMYKISGLTVKDSSSSNGYGGFLYKDSSGSSKTYNINTSSSYENRFNGSRGKVNQTCDYSYENKTYTLGGSASNSTEASQAISSVGKNGAVNKVDLNIKVNYDNQYIELDGKTDMLTQNLKTYTHTVGGDDNFTVDATRNCNYTKNLKAYMKPSNTTDYDDFAINKLKIAEVGDNGVRLLSGQINYQIVTNSKYNIGGNSFESVDYTYETNSSKKVNVTNSSLEGINKTFNSSNNYANNSSAKNEVRQVNVLTPLNFANDQDMLDSYENVVDMSLGGQKKLILQQGKEFTVTPKMQSGHSSYNFSYDANKFVDYYYVICDFETNNNEAYTPYKVTNGGNIKLTPTSVINNEAVSSENNNIYIIAVSKNATPRIKSQVESDFSNASTTYTSIRYGKDYISGNENSAKTLSEWDFQSDNGYLTLKRLGASNHVVMRTITTDIINRIYDFEVTDCTDLSFKNVFRDEDTSTNVNEGTKVAYFSGTKYLLVESGEARIMLDRIDLGTPKTIIPLGPYKNTDSTYIFAPKLGYRISFDLKTTGYLNENLGDGDNTNDRYVGIVPRYYYISKDGKNYKNNITLYYKDSSGKYKRISRYIPNGEGSYTVQTGGNYNLYFKPNDGYRYLRGAIDSSGSEFDLSYMSTKLKTVNISNSTVNTLNCNNATNNTKFPIKLTREMMSLDAKNDGFIQTWYGEFKLPNSTIAVDNTDSNSNVNNPLSDGYIGVIFDIYCVDPDNNVLYYSKNDKNGISSTNTSQWDYEGYLGFNNPGSPVDNISIQLEKGPWRINNNVYNEIKGTVLLYDIDARAANDFN